MHVKGYGVMWCAMLMASLPGTRVTAQVAPSGWKLVLRIRPNPIPLGRCAGIDIELQDPDGFRTNVMSNGQSLDQRHFLFTSSNTTSFSWRDNDPTAGVVCASATAPPAVTKIRVVLPDGVAGEVALTSIPPGVAATPMAYPPQARLRPPGFVSAVPPAVTSAASVAAPGAPARAAGAAPANPATAAPKSIHASSVPPGSTSATVYPIEIYTMPIHGVGDCPTAKSCTR